MKKETLITIAVIGGLILLGIGFSLVLSSGQKAIKEVKAPLADLLESKVITGLITTASGEVTEISDRNLTLSKEGDTLTILIREDAPIYQEVLPEEETPGVPRPVMREEIEFGEIKVGDQVDISCGLKADASLEGIEVTVLL